MRSIDYNNRDLYAFEVLEIGMDLMNGDNDEHDDGDLVTVSIVFVKSLIFIID